jgi:hypothetical protein
VDAAFVDVVRVDPVPIEIPLESSSDMYVNATDIGEQLVLMQQPPSTNSDRLGLN